MLLELIPIEVCWSNKQHDNYYLNVVNCNSVEISVILDAIEKQEAMEYKTETE